MALRHYFFNIVQDEGLKKLPLHRPKQLYKVPWMTLRDYVMPDILYAQPDVRDSEHEIRAMRIKPVRPFNRRIYIDIKID